jgi:cupin 2 domain-containing protein
MNPLTPHAPQNIYTDIPEVMSNEFFQILHKTSNMKIERIISRGHSTPAGQWYDQDSDEWVILLKGQATLSYEDTTQPVNLSTGDYLFIPAHTKHRVDWTHQSCESIWLAIHFN